MATLTLKDLSFDLPIGLDPTEEQITEWLGFELGITSSISLKNPLVDLEIKDCNLQIGGVLVDGNSINV